MAVIGSFFESREGRGLHRTVVECGWQTLRHNGETILQLSTYGSDERQSEKKVSQTIQLDRARAEELMNIVRQAFPDL
jgi:hypothetical protein